jgi:hypothetical protein
MAVPASLFNLRRKNRVFFYQKKFFVKKREKTAKKRESA